MKTGFAQILGRPLTDGEEKAVWETTGRASALFDAAFKEARPNMEARQNMDHCDVRFIAMLLAQAHTLGAALGFGKEVIRGNSTAVEVFVLTALGTSAAQSQRVLRELIAEAHEERKKREDKS